MKVECTICTMQQTVRDETKKEVSDIVNKYKLPAISYIKILNMICGKCLNGDEHSFQFTEDFMKEVSDTVDNFRKSQTEIQKLIEENGKCGKELNEHEAKIKELKTKIEANEDRMDGLERDTAGYKVDICTMTGADDITIWY
jgi:predicted RNase H-like nuclease (RuvC/YqgF family)